MSIRHLRYRTAFCGAFFSVASHFVISDERPIDDELCRFLAMAYAIGRREDIAARTPPRQKQHESR
jgi:hypothetical protein